MNIPQGELQRRLDQLRYRRAIPAVLTRAHRAGVEIPPANVLDWSDATEVWDVFSAALRERTPAARSWPRDGADLSEHLSKIRGLLSPDSLWLAMSGHTIVGIRVATEAVIANALEHFVDSAHDLFLTDREVSWGLAVGLNHLPSGDEYELITWGQPDVAADTP